MQRGRGNGDCAQLGDGGVIRCTSLDRARLKKLPDDRLHAIAASHAKLADDLQRDARKAQSWADAARKELKRRKGATDAN